MGVVSCLTLMFVCGASKPAIDAPPRPPVAATQVHAGPRAQPSRTSAQATLRGDAINATQRELFAHGRNVSDLVETLLVDALDQAPGGGPIATLEPMQLSLFGYSWAQTRSRVGRLDITDVARIGQPLITLPFMAWDQAIVRSLWTQAPEVGLCLRAGSPVWRASVAATGSFEAGGSVWMPKNVFDREPTFAFGAPLLRRALIDGRELSMRLTGPLGPARLMAVAEHIDNTNRFIAPFVHDQGGRDTIVLALDTPWQRGQLKLFGAYQGLVRDHFGAPWRWPVFAHQDQRSRAFMLAGEWLKSFSHGLQVALALSLGAKDESFVPKQALPWAVEALDQGTFIAPIALFVSSSSWQLNGSLQLGLRGDDKSIRANTAMLSAQGQRVPGRLKLVVEGHLGQWTRRSDTSAPNVAAPVAGTSTPTVLLDPHTQSRAGMARLYTGIDLKAPLSNDGAYVVAHAGVDWSAALMHDTMFMVRPGPAAGVALRWPMGLGAEIFVAVRREAEQLLANAVDFTKSQRDDGATLGQTHAGPSDTPRVDGLAASLAPTRTLFGPQRLAAIKRPAHSVIIVGATSPKIFGVFAGVRGIAHITSHAYQPCLNNQASYTPTPFLDPGSDGRDFKPPQNLVAYARNAEQTTPTFVQLCASERLATALMFEAELATSMTSKVFLALVGRMQIAQGQAGFGAGPFANDLAMLNAQSAYPNQQINRFGHLDNDRAYGLRLFLGVRPTNKLSIALSARYRDGEPFARLVVDDALPQGPEIIMAVPRGTERATFRMNFNMRVRYEDLRLGPLSLTAFADVYNLLNSGTELLEDARSGATFRNSLEAVPGRAISLGIAMAFLP